VWWGVRSRGWGARQPIGELPRFAPHPHPRPCPAKRRGVCALALPTLQDRAGARSPGRHLGRGLPVVQLLDAHRPLGKVEEVGEAAALPAHVAGEENEDEAEQEDEAAQEGAAAGRRGVAGGVAAPRLAAYHARRAGDRPQAAAVVAEPPALVAQGLRVGLAEVHLGPVPVGHRLQGFWSSGYTLLPHDMQPLVGARGGVRGACQGHRWFSAANCSKSRRQKRCVTLLTSKGENEPPPAARALAWAQLAHELRLVTSVVAAGALEVPKHLVRALVGRELAL
jgi:hypothetical protein